MSIPTTEAGPSISKVEKRRLKEEKRARKAAKAARQAKRAPSSGGAPTGAQLVGEQYAKAGKVQEDGTPAVDAARTKKMKRKVYDDSGVPTPAETPIVTPPEVISVEPVLKKKKIWKAEHTENEQSVGVSNGTADSKSAKRQFTEDDRTYLAKHSIILEPSIFPPHTSISALPVHPALLKYMKRFTDPTPIQAASWPGLLAGRDVVGIAETGSGKTLAFGVPGMDRLSSTDGDKKKRIRMLVIAPTRELAQQSHDTLVALGEESKIRSICIFGGVGKAEQVMGIKKARVVVGTPGRLLDLADAGDLDLSESVFSCGLDLIS